ncbi:hypothetical protein PG996_006503 [Apiospora saccharicola]|uniref:Methyltransferase domain-containing protein n=1 Tax=Apiospora saccharicola TaxID=335842 RepID=A0ABR1VPI1_9PEZI
MWAFLSCLSSSHVLCVLAGFLAGVLAPQCQWPNIRFTRPKATEDGWGFGKRNDRLYGLEHGKLNLELPPKSMWMNMGFWRDTDDFPTACQALLVEVLRKAKLLEDDNTGKGKSSPTTPPRLRSGLKRLSILDLGFGCGDQTAYLVQLARIPLKYVGITLNYRQYRFAQNRLGPSCSSSDKGTKRDVQLFCEDAARTDSWPEGLRSAVSSLNNNNRNNATDQNTKKNNTSQQSSAEETWVLALDSLYHFHPSRQPVLSLAAQDLNASLMAFDLLVSDSASWHQRWALKLVAWLGDCPVRGGGPFLTRAQYAEMLVEAGYDRNKIELHDVTGDVFEPLARYMRRRGGELEDVGLTLGSLNVARLVFGWWARSGVLEAVIVVARKSSSPDAKGKA